LGKPLRPVRLVKRREDLLGGRRRPIQHALVEQAGDRVERRLVDRLGLIDGDGGLLDGALSQHEDQAGHPLVHRDEIDPPDVRGVRLRRRRDPRGAGQPGEGRRGEAEPVLARELDLPELVSDHQLLDSRQRDGIGDRLDEEPIAGIRRDATGARVGMRQQAGCLELREDVPHGRARHAKAVSVDERLARDRLCRRDIFLDDGPKDRLRAEVQRAEWAADASRQTRSPVALALYGSEC
jgi:hypothetical protein